MNAPRTNDTNLLLFIRSLTRLLSLSQFFGISITGESSRVDYVQCTPFELPSKWYALLSISFECVAWASDTLEFSVCVGFKVVFVSCGNRCNQSVKIDSWATAPLPNDSYNSRAKCICSLFSVQYLSMHILLPEWANDAHRAVICSM